jgi:hypothetical protein
MKKKKKIGLSLNKKVVSNLNLTNIKGGGSIQCNSESIRNYASCVNCQTENGCTSYDVKRCPFA